MIHWLLAYSWLLLLVVFPTLLIKQAYLLGCKMSQPEKMLHTLPAAFDCRQKETVAQHAEWLASMDLEFRTMYQFGDLQVIVYQQQNRPRFFSFLFHQRVTSCATSYLAELTILETSNSGCLGIFPRPRSYVQSFPNLPARETWQRHLAAEAYLTEKFGFQLRPVDRPYEELVTEGIRINMKYNRSLFLWPVRVLYRYFVTRHLIANRTVQQQFP